MQNKCVQQEFIACYCQETVPTHSKNYFKLFKWLKQARSRNNLSFPTYDYT